MNTREKLYGKLRRLQAHYERACRDSRWESAEELGRVIEALRTEFYAR